MIMEAINRIFFLLQQSASSKRKYDQVSDDNDSISTSSDEDSHEESNVWKNWLKFPNAEKNNTNFHPFSPEKHKIVRCGHGISPRPYLDPSLYKKHLKRHKVLRFPLLVECTTYIDAVLNSNTIRIFEKKIMAVPEFENNNIQNAVDFLNDIFLSALRLYKSKQDLTSSESVFNHLLIYRFMDSVALSIQNKHDCGSDFIPGEAYLSAVKKQLKDIGNYKDD
ncbi:hypothetical protein G6F56_004682 [Rhizopus delemar]|nr:hypothetical protein G6F56_004682 [Rhizopus delemar]